MSSRVMCAQRKTFDQYVKEVQTIDAVRELLCCWKVLYVHTTVLILVHTTS